MYKEDETSKTFMPSKYDPVENGKWKGSIEECIEFIREDISEIKKTIDNIYSKVNRIDKEVEVLKFKSGIWGFLAGLLPALVAFIYWFVSRK